MRVSSGRAEAAARWAAALALASLLGCADAVWPDRDPRATEVRVDSLKLLPAGGRYLLKDSLSSVLFRGYNKGYLCSRLLEFGLVPDSADPLALVARVRVELPSDAGCPLDSARDSLASQRFRGAPDTVLRLLAGPGRPTDSARLVRGRLDQDSLVYVTSTTGTVTRGRFTYRDSSSLAGRLLHADTLGPCESLNHAAFTKSKDTTKVRFSWVALDPIPSAGADSCRAGPVDRDDLAVRPARKDGL